MRFPSRLFLLVMLLSVSFICAGSAAAQTYPSRPITMIIPYNAGGGTDNIFRALQPGLSENLGQPVLIENRPGGSATIGMNMAAKSSPDGYTLGIANLAFSANPCLMTKMPFDTEKDLVPVSQVYSYPMVLVVNPSVPARSLKKLIALAKAKPGSLNYGSSGNGTISHLLPELFKYMAGINMVHVPYKGASPQVIAAISGETQVMFTGIASSIQHMKSGKLVPLGVATAKRVTLLPDVPTITEAGLPGFDAAEWGGVMAPAGTPSAVINRLHQALFKTLARPDLKERLMQQLGAAAVGSTPEEFAAFIKTETGRWCEVIKRAGIRQD